jgi:nucleolar protein 15
VQFKDEETAKVAAETMNNFILFDRILKCSIVEDTKKYSLLFLKYKRKFKFCNKYKNFVENKNKKKSPEETKSYIQFLLDKEEERRKKLKAKKIKYDFPGYVKFTINLEKLCRKILKKIKK